MGAYSNPQLIVDTQTGEHLRGLQSSIAGAVSNFGQSYAVKQKEIKKKLEENKMKLDEINNQVDEYAFALRTGVNKIDSGSDKLDLASTFEPLIQEAVKLKSGLLNNTLSGQDRQRAMQKLADINSTVSGNFSSSLSELSSFGQILNDASLKPIGSEGGLAEDMKAEDVRALRIMQGKLGGTKKAVYKDGDPNNLVWQVYDDSNELVKEYAASKLKKMSDLGNEYIKLVPDRTANNESLKTNNPNIFETLPVNPKDPEKGSQSTGRLKDDFLEKDENGQIKTEKRFVGNEKSGVYKLVAKPDYKKIELALTPQIDSQIAGMTDEELMLYTNNVVNKHREKTNIPPIYFDSDGLLDNTEREHAITAYKEYFLSTQIAKQQDMLKEDSSVLLFEGERIGKSGSKPSKTTKPKAKKVTFNEVSKLVYNQQPGEINDFAWGNKKVSYDGSVFFVTSGGNEGAVFKTKADVVNYLKTGKIK